MFSVHLLIAFNVSIEDGRKESNGGCYDWEPDLRGDKDLDGCESEDKDEDKNKDKKDLHDKDPGGGESMQS